MTREWPDSSWSNAGAWLSDGDKHEHTAAGHLQKCMDTCTEACEMCAMECEKSADDDQLARGAKECRTCAKSCRDMVAHMGQHPAAAKDKAAAR